ncbi:regulatory protein RecX [Psychroflexus planctonicus]|uniref:Regulatory protein RecX n=1 Tax=Psychroflexus planctonicus TaxID=1526575 RepID=A0ABQ1SHZ8_9FLAO|nr:regulatory protein RecX [Psychroflexus planctonicus]GGE40580.1 recombinase RecX [Psychroflexus planctonicus]
MNFSEHKNIKSYTVKEALAALMKYCAYQDRCHKEVEEKLQKMNMIPAAQEQIIIQLIQDGFLNEERFTRSFVRGKFNFKHWGKQKIRMHLKQKNIPEHLIKIGMQEINQEEYTATLKQLATKKWKSLGTAKDAKTKQKVIQHLLYKGYESELVYEIVNGLIQF